MTTDEIKQIGEELDRILKPVYDDLDELKKDVKDVKKTQKEHTEMIDALTGDVMTLQGQMGAVHDDIKIIKERHQKDTEEIKEFIGIQTQSS